MKVEMMMIGIDEDYNDNYYPNVHEDLMDQVPNDVHYEKMLRSLCSGHIHDKINDDFIDEAIDTVYG